MEIDDRGGRLALMHELERVVGPACCRDVIVAHPQEVLERLAEPGFVFDEEDEGRSGHADRIGADSASQ
jgi:hypothetical protein